MGSSVLFKLEGTRVKDNEQGAHSRQPYKAARHTSRQTSLEEDLRVSSSCYEYLRTRDPHPYLLDILLSPIWTKQSRLESIHSISIIQADLIGEGPGIRTKLWSG